MTTATSDDPTKSPRPDAAETETGLYKFTDSAGYTRRGKSGEMKWQLEVPAPVLSGAGSVCGPTVYHAYVDPLLAVLFDPIAGQYTLPPGRPHLYRCRGSICAVDCGFKVGCTTITLLERVQMPIFSTDQRIAFAIFCAQAVAILWPSTGWNEWAAGWLANRDNNSVIKVRDDAASAASFAMDDCDPAVAYAASAARYAAAAAIPHYREPAARSAYLAAYAGAVAANINRAKTRLSAFARKAQALK